MKTLRGLAKTFERCYLLKTFLGVALQILALWAALMLIYIVGLEISLIF